jgi:hypothetical protein
MFHVWSLEVFASPSTWRHLGKPLSGLRVSRQSRSLSLSLRETVGGNQSISLSQASSAAARPMMTSMRQTQ